MEYIYAEIELINSYDLGMDKSNLQNQDEIKKTIVNAQADTRYLFLWINENIQSILNLPCIQKELLLLKMEYRKYLM